MATSRIAESVGRVLGDRYRLTRPLGSGATANVFVAEDVRLRRRVAVKVLDPGLATEEAFLRRFHREARAVASLKHPNILRVYDWGDEGGTPYLVMELLEGGTLRSMLDRGALLSAAQAATVGAGAAKALAYAHRQGLVHRDIKPANLIFDEEGHVYVADFGLARALAEASWTEPNGAVVGTARYSSPELVRGEHLDAKSDVYSLALVLVEAMTGSVPFAADTAMGSLMARLGRSMEPPAETGPLAPVLAAAGTVDTEERLDAATFARRLEEVAGRLPYPAPLSLTSPISGGEPERDDISPTVMPGRPRLYDDAEFAESASAPIDLRAPAPEVTDRRRSAPEADSFVAYEADTDPPRRRRRAIIAIAAAVLLIVAAAAVWGVTSGGFLEPEEQVPAVIGLAQPQAATAVSGDHLHLVVTGSEYNAKPAGQVIAQTPAGGRLRRGSDVRVVVSKGPAPVPVPALTNDTVSEAEQVLHTLGIKWTITHATSMTVLANEIISTDPASGTIVPGQTMNLVVSSGKPTVPVPPITLNTESVADAEAALHTAGLTFTATPAYSNTVPKNDVISVSPPSGTQAQVGSEVTLTFSQGPHYVIVPPTKDDSVGNATEILDAAGFNVTGVQGNPVNTVKGTSPPAGQQVLYGSSIQILTH